MINVTATKIITTKAKTIMTMTINHSKITITGIDKAIAQWLLCCKFIMSTKSYNNPIMQILSLSHLTDEKTKAQRN